LDQPPKRKHRATGHKPPGGKRPGAGRPEGTPNALEYGEVKAVKVAGLRVPEDASPEAKALADRTQQRIIDVMEERVNAFLARPVLQAATELRKEICGEVAKRLEHTGKDGGELVVKVVEFTGDGDA
jgi:hypothetical protein